MKTLRLMLAIVLAVFTAADLWGAQERMEIQSASQPLDEGVPEVAVGRLQQLLRSALAPQEKRDVLLKLSEALVAAGDGETALKVLGDPQLRNVSAGNFWQGQAFASLGRWPEALAAYDKVVVAEKNPLCVRTACSERRRHCAP